MKNIMKDNVQTTIPSWVVVTKKGHPVSKVIDMTSTATTTSNNFFNILSNEDIDTVDLSIEPSPKKCRMQRL